MVSRRVLKAAEAIREVVSLAILTELRDPRIRDVTVTHVEVAPDMRTAKVHVSVMGNESRQQLSLRGLANASGFLQQRIADRIDTRYTPRLLFVLDKGVKNALEVSRILAQVLPKPPADVLDEELDEPERELDADVIDAPSVTADDERGGLEFGNPDLGDDETASAHGGTPPA